MASPLVVTRRMGAEGAAGGAELAGAREEAVQAVQAVEANMPHCPVVHIDSARRVLLSHFSSRHLCRSQCSRAHALLVAAATSTGP